MPFDCDTKLFQASCSRLFLPRFSLLSLHGRSLLFGGDLNSQAREFQKDLKARMDFNIFKLVLASKVGKCFGHFNIINTITWLSCLFGWAHLGMLFGLEVYRKMVMASIEDYFDFPDTLSTLEVMRLSDSMAEFSSYQRIFISYAHILFMARCFLSLQWQPRLAIITSTLQALKS